VGTRISSNPTTSEEYRVATDSTGSERVDEAAQASRKARTAAEQRAEASPTSDDPEVLASEIEKTREELAETLDAIADKVSPKRVADRTKKKAGDSVKEGAATVKAGATQLKDAVVEKKDELTGGAGDSAQDGVEDALESVGQDPTAAMAGGEASGLGPVPGATPSGGVPTTSPGLRPVPAPSAVDGYGSSPALGAPALAGAAAALVVALYLLRRRRRR
jgi:hypothetical protein